MLNLIANFKHYSKCFFDSIYAIENNFRVFSLINQTDVPFLLFNKQKEIIRAYDKHRFNLIIKGRQTGGSSLTEAYVAIKATYIETEPENILLVSPNLEGGKMRLNNIKKFLTQLPRFLWGPEYYGSPKNESKSIFLRDTKTEIKLPNGSTIKIVSSSPDAFRGFHASLIILDDAAHIKNNLDIYSALISMLGVKGSKLIILATPNGDDKLVYPLYQKIKKGETGFNLLEMKWYDDARFNNDLKWYKNDEICNEIEYTVESHQNKINEGWKPTSIWYEEMVKSLNNPYTIAQELDCLFIDKNGDELFDK